MIYQTNIITLQSFLSKVKGTLDFNMYTNTSLGKTEIKTWVGNYRYSSHREDNTSNLIDSGSSNQVTAEGIDTSRLKLIEFSINKSDEICLTVENYSGEDHVSSLYREATRSITEKEGIAEPEPEGDAVG